MCKIKHRTTTLNPSYCLIIEFGQPMHYGETAMHFMSHLLGDQLDWIPLMNHQWELYHPLCLRLACYDTHLPEKFAQKQASLTFIYLSVWTFTQETDLLGLDVLVFKLEVFQEIQTSCLFGLLCFHSIEHKRQSIEGSLAKSRDRLSSLYTASLKSKKI